MCLAIHIAARHTNSLLEDGVPPACASGIGCAVAGTPELSEVT